MEGIKGFEDRIVAERKPVPFEFLSYNFFSGDYLKAFNYATGESKHYVILISSLN